MRACVLKSVSGHEHRSSVHRVAPELKDFSRDTAAVIFKNEGHNCCKLKSDIILIAFID